MKLELPAELWGLMDLAEPTVRLSYIALAVVSSALRVTKSSLLGGTSMIFLFVLISLEDLAISEVLVIGALAILITSPLQVRGQQRLMITLADLLAFGSGALAAHWAFFSPVLYTGLVESTIRYVAAATACCAAMAIPAYVIVRLTSTGPEQAGFRDVLLSMTAYQFVSGVVAGMLSVSIDRMGWQSVAIYLPVTILLWYSYRLSLNRLEGHRARRREIEELHMRTIETLALAIGARDHEMSRHLERVRVYAVEMGNAMGLSRNEIEGLKAAAMLHDIGKLGVPEHIISKPGRLTPEEFEKMKVHPVVGAEILARVNFPYPVVPYVRHHHERWDGSGYPDGLKGDAIPIGARILTVVDCLDALASDRQYRRAVPVHEAVEQVAAGSGKQFDPRIIALLKKNYPEWERMVAREKHERADQTRMEPSQIFERVVRTIGSTSAEVNSMFELIQEMGNSLNLADTFKTLAAGLKRLIPYSGIAVYMSRRGRLQARYMTGDFPSVPDSLELEIGEGISGRVASTGVAVVNGHPGQESRDALVSIYFSRFRSALSIAIPDGDSVVGVVTLYHVDPNAFSTDHLRKLQALAPKLSQAVVNGMRFKLAEDKAGTDHLTGLPNAHSLYLHLERELGLSRCMNTPLAVLICDLNGFKLVNDTLGHLVGNKLLQAVGAALKENCRDYDFVARMGGDEFVLVLSGVHEDAAVARIRELREVIRRASSEVCREGTIFGSLGLAMFPQDAQNADELLAFADRNMYRDKEEQKALYTPALAPIRPWKPPVAGTDGASGYSGSVLASGPLAFTPADKA
jgi:diguanylate cyclase (GGDEF)-like protein/putative nucleotidyltransferase with HDIG domain